MKYLIFTAVILAVAVAQRRYPIFERSCEERKAYFNNFAKTDFSTAAYTGSWFEISRYQQQDEPETDCMVSRYSWGFISRTFQIDRDGRDFLTNNNFRRNASALVAFPDERPLRGMLNVTYYGNSVADEVNYYVIATDYFQYAVGWGCENLQQNRSREFAWVLSRTPEWPANSTYPERVANLTALHFDEEFLRPTMQSEAYCFDRIMPGAV